MSESTSSAPVDLLYLLIRSPSFPDHVVRVPASACVSDLADELQRACPGRPAPANQTLIYAGKVLKDPQQRLSDVVKDITKGGTFTFHLVIKNTSTSKTGEDSSAAASTSAAQPSVGVSSPPGVPPSSLAASSSTSITTEQAPPPSTAAAPSGLHQQQQQQSQPRQIRITSAREQQESAQAQPPPPLPPPQQHQQQPPPPQQQQQQQAQQYPYVMVSPTVAAAYQAAYAAAIAAGNAFQAAAAAADGASTSAPPPAAASTVAPMAFYYPALGQVLFSMSSPQFAHPLQLPVDLTAAMYGMAPSGLLQARVLLGGGGSASAAGGGGAQGLAEAQRLAAGLRQRLAGGAGGAAQQPHRRGHRPRVFMIRVSIRMLLQLLVCAVVLYQHFTLRRFLALFGGGAVLYAAVLWAPLRRLAAGLHLPHVAQHQEGGGQPAARGLAARGRNALQEVAVFLLGFITSLLPGWNFNPEDAAAFAVAQNAERREGDAGGDAAAAAAAAAAPPAAAPVGQANAGAARHAADEAAAEPAPA